MFAHGFQAFTFWRIISASGSGCMNSLAKLIIVPGARDWQCSDTLTLASWHPNATLDLGLLSPIRNAGNGTVTQLTKHSAVISWTHAGTSSCHGLIILHTEAPFFAETASHCSLHPKQLNMLLPRGSHGMKCVLKAQHQHHSHLLLLPSTLSNRSF